MKDANNEARMNRQVTFTLSEQDLRLAGRLHVFSWLREPRAMARMLAIWVGAMAVLLGFLYWTGVPWPRLSEKLPLFAFVPVAVVFSVAFVVPLVLGPIVVRRRFRQDKLLRQPVTASWDESAYQAEQPGIYNRIPWGDYAKWREDRHLFLFFLSDYSYQVLPKRALAPEQIADIQKVLSAY